MNRAAERLHNGIIKENPTLVLMLGMCPTLAVTTSAVNGLGMGLTTTVVLALSNLIISLLRGIIPSRVRIPAFIVIIASFVTSVQLMLEAYLPFLNKALGMYIPLIVVNCIILGRAESYAYSNPVLPSLFDGLGMGLGFTLSPVSARCGNSWAQASSSASGFCPIPLSPSVSSAKRRGPSSFLQAWWLCRII